MLGLMLDKQLKRQNDSICTGMIFTLGQQDGKICRQFQQKGRNPAEVGRFEYQQGTQKSSDYLAKRFMRSIVFPGNDKWGVGPGKIFVLRKTV